MSLTKHTAKLAAAAVCAVAVIAGMVKTQHPDIRTSQAGLELIGNAEGCRRDPYRCPADVLTVGIGSTAAGGEPINPNRLYSEQEIADRWAKDIAAAERCVNQFAGGANLPQGAFDALTSITFNVGCGRLKNSTLFKQARQGYRPEMCHELKKWVYAGGRKLNGLEKRRQKETALCLQSAVEKNGKILTGYL